MNTRRLTSLSEKTRLAILVLYVGGFFVTSRLAHGTWMPPASEKGLWFYSGLAALVLGDLLETPFFTKPADAISYSVACILGLLAVNPWASVGASTYIQSAWLIAIALAAALLLAAIATIVLRPSQPLADQRLSRSLFVVCEELGNPRVIFSVVFLYALLAYHRGSLREFAPITIAWAVAVGFRPLEASAHFLRRCQSIWRGEERLARLGEVVGHEVPNVVLVREEQGQRAAFGDLLVARSDNGEAGYALALDHVGFAEGRWLRAMHLSAYSNQIGARASEGSAYLVSPAGVKVYPGHPLFQARDQVLGLVAADSTVGLLNIEIIRDDLALHQGTLVSVHIGGEEVLYQIVEGTTREEILYQKNTRGFVRARARKIGSWNAASGAFDSVAWLPQPNAPVLLVAPQEPPPDSQAVGHFPETSYPVSLDLNALVTHNAAILGILGVGKSFLALELVERMIRSGIKVVCLDLTDQYATELHPFHNAEREEEKLAELNEIGQGGKTEVRQNVEEGGSIRGFARMMKAHLLEFLDPTCADMLKIYNPARFEVWRQDSKPYNYRASMASLTPCEVTRIISEAALDVLQKQGMTDRARCCLVYEEAHSLIPEWNAVASDGDKAATNGTCKAILQGRKFGLGCLVITQRTANVTKSILNQCNTVLALRVFDATGMEFLRNYIGDDYAGVLSSLQDRHAIVFGRASSCRDPVLIRLNERDAFLTAFRQATAEPAPTPGAAL